MSYFYENLWRLSTPQSLAVAPAAGAAVSCNAFGTETYAIRVCFPGSVSSTGGLRITVIDPQSPAVSSTTGALVPPNWVETIKVTPGQKISAISNDAGTFNLNITELTK